MCRLSLVSCAKICNSAKRSGVDKWAIRCSRRCLAISSSRNRRFRLRRRCSRIRPRFRFRFRQMRMQIINSKISKTDSPIALQSISPPPRKHNNSNDNRQSPTSTTPISPIRQRFTQNRRCNAATQTDSNLDDGRPLSSSRSSNSLISGGSYSPPNQVAFYHWTLSALKLTTNLIEFRKNLCSGYSVLRIPTILNVPF